MPTLYVPVPLSRAEGIAHALVEERLAAAVNRVNCTSTYRWNGEVQYRDEAVLLVSTTEHRCEDLVARLLELHPYDVPRIERFDESWCHPPAAEWRDGAVD